MRSLSAIALVSLAAAAAACGGDGNTSGIADACNPLGTGACLLPWPSSAYLKADPSTATGYRVDLDVAGMPVNIDKHPIAVEPYNRWDGFSPSGPILAQFPTGVSAHGLPAPDDPGASLAADSPIVLLDMDRMERAPFFAEIDQNIDNVEQRALIIRPVIRLHPKTRYAVALRKSLEAADGSPLASPPGYVALDAGDTLGHPRADVDRHREVVAALATAGVPSDDLVLAWDFVTASDEMLTSDMLTMRDAAVTAIGDAGANLSFTATERAANGAYTSKSYVGTFTSPDFLTDAEQDDSIIRRDADDRPMMQGMRQANFAAVIPKCAETATLPIPAIVFGHGIFGNASDTLDDDFLQKVANQYCFVVVAGDFIGLTDRQLAAAATTANDLAKAGRVTEKLGQSIIDFIALENLVRGKLNASPQFQRDGAPIIDATKVFYLGGSLGGIMGNAFMAYDPTITRGALGVPGGAWSMLFERSVSWLPLKAAAQGSYTDPLVYPELVALLGMRFEPFDPITTAPRVVHDPLPNTPAKQILMYEAIGDCLVTNYSTEMVVRTMGLSMMMPSVKMPWNIPAAAGTPSSGFTVYDEHPTPLPPTTINLPPSTDNGTHSGVNRRQAVLDAVHTFLLGGNVTQACKVGEQAAACDCATGACGQRI
ncbi:MAG TPA: hypothetical protein VHE35_10790 [Kofleriaceae bacterium]|nr:hypothetical protein [Kofleriaceae bacterium]